MRSLKCVRQITGKVPFSKFRVSLARNNIFDAVKSILLYQLYVPVQQTIVPSKSIEISELITANHSTGNMQISNHSAGNKSRSFLYFCGHYSRLLYLTKVGKKLVRQLYMASTFVFFLFSFFCQRVYNFPSIYTPPRRRRRSFCPRRRRFEYRRRRPPLILSSIKYNRYIM